MPNICYIGFQRNYIQCYKMKLFELENLGQNFTLSVNPDNHQTSLARLGLCNDPDRQSLHLFSTYIFQLKRAVSSQMHLKCLRSLYDTHVMLEFKKLFHMQEIWHNTVGKINSSYNFSSSWETIYTLYMTTDTHSQKDNPSTNVIIAIIL